LALLRRKVENADPPRRVRDHRASAPFIEKRECPPQPLAFLTVLSDA
jgi:hypothetical protein